MNVSIDLPDDAIERIAQRAAEIVAARSAPAREDGWLDSKRAAGYLGISLYALHRLTAARCVPFEQAAPGCRCWFKRSDLDAWVRAGMRGSGAARVG